MAVMAATIRKLSSGETAAPSYITRVLWLTLLAPEIVVAILDGKQGPVLTQGRRLEPFPGAWALQMVHLGPERKTRHS